MPKANIPAKRTPIVVSPRSRPRLVIQPMARAPFRRRDRGPEVERQLEQIRRDHAGKRRD
jgi:hypothetical protein